jgi:hypothetical protein
MAAPPQKAPVQLPIEIPPDLQPVYANLARISHAPAEFVMDFARILPGDSKASVTARVIMTPVGLKLLLQALNENLARFEATFGPVNIPTGGPSLADHLFRPHHPPAQGGDGGPEPPPGPAGEPPDEPKK